MIEFLVGLALLVWFLWTVWGLIVFLQELGAPDSFRHMAWYESVALVGPLLFLFYVSYWVGFAILHPAGS